jgi:primosomal protein N' (replication factor Y)
MDEIFNNQDFQERITLFVNVLLPVPIPQLFTYRVPFELNDYIKIGARVVVQFGQKRILTALVIELHETPPKGYQAKYILELMDEEPIVTPKQLKLWQWTADYYLCSQGEVMNVALPAGLKLSSQSRVQLNPDFEFGEKKEGLEIEFSDREQKIVDALLEKQSLTFDDISTLINLQNIYNILKSLLRKNVIIIFEEIKDKYKPKIINKIRIAPAYNSVAAIEKLFQDLEKKPKQTDVLLKYLSLIPIHELSEKNQQGITKNILTQNGVSVSALQTLIKNEIFHEFEEIVSRFAELDEEKLAEIHLTTYQQEVESQILSHYQNKDTVLLHGVTGSGKTEIYISLIQKVLESGSQVLLLLPEIALTTQIVARLKKVFGFKLGVYHSKFSDNERVEVWKGILNGQFSIVVGVRSAMLLPFNNLGLIIVDEEHDPSYKQYDPAPRYNARDLALVASGLHQCKVLLGSATPSLESYYQALAGKYALVKADKRFGNAQLPEIRLIDTKIEKQQKSMKNDFSKALLDQINEKLTQKEQVILFQNRRGYAPHITCDECGMIPKCQNCSVSLTYHLAKHELTCHYCGYKIDPPTSCGVCGSTKIKTVGFGTEKIEENLKSILPEVRIQRMDLDTTRSKMSYQNIIQDFAAKNIDILVGTQMVTKGLDFDHVNLVGVFDVDRMLHFPDFRSHERTFQLITQVAGRAGRREKKGLVLVQTANPTHPLLKKIIAGDYVDFYETEIKERQVYFYPPFSRMICLTLKHEEQETVSMLADKLANNLKQKLGSQRILGPESPIIDRLRNKYLKEIFVKLERDKINSKEVKKMILVEVQALTADKQYRQIEISIDVDPV